MFWCGYLILCDGGGGGGGGLDSDGIIKKCWHLVIYVGWINPSYAEPSTKD